MHRIGLESVGGLEYKCKDGPLCLRVYYGFTTGLCTATLAKPYKKPSAVPASSMASEWMNNGTTPSLRSLRSHDQSHKGPFHHRHAPTNSSPAALEHYHRAKAIHEELSIRSSVDKLTGNIIDAYLAMGSDVETQLLLATMDAMQIDEPAHPSIDAREKEV